MKKSPKGSGTISSSGYLLFHYKGKQIPEHRIIMSQILGRELESSEIIHHIDGNKLNNHPDNLVITNRAEHAREHCDDKQMEQFKSIQHLGSKSLIKVQKDRPEPQFEGQRWNHHKTRRGFMVRKCPDCSKLFWQRHDNRHTLGLCKLCNPRRANKLRWKH